MHNWIKENNKKVMAVLGAVLMVSFLITTGPGSRDTGPRKHTEAIGKAGDFVLYKDDLGTYGYEWKMLAASITTDGPRRFRALDSSDPRMGDQYQPHALGETMVSQIEAHPELFPLLVHEAESRGIDFSDDAVKNFAETRIRCQIAGPEDPAFLQAVKHYLMLSSLRGLLTSQTKYTEPMAKLDLSHRQSVDLNLVDFPANAFKPAIPDPQLIQSLFEQYRHVAPNAFSRSAGNPLGFGYEIPNQVKVQYLMVSRDAVIAALKAAHADPQNKADVDYDLREKALEYYYAHQQDYAMAPATQPATTEPSTTQPATQAASTQPTTRPFAEVKNEILNQVLAADADDLQTKILDAITAQLTADYQAYQKNPPATQPALSIEAATTQAADAILAKPTTVPSVVSAVLGAATQPVANETYTKLEALAVKIQAQFNVLPQITQPAGWQDSSALSQLSGIGQASAGQPFSDIAMNSVAFQTDSAAKATSLQLWQPSAVLRDSAQNAYVFRLTETSLAHAPELAEVLPRVTEDARLKAGYDAANDAAQKMLTMAQKGGLTAAARDTGRSIISTQTFSPDQLLSFDQQNDAPRMIPGYPASFETTFALAHKATELRDDATAANQHPLGLLPLPEERRVLLIELSDLTMNIPEQLRYQLRLYMAQDQEFKASEMSLAHDYFDYPNVIARLNYQSTEQQKP